MSRSFFGKAKSTIKSNDVKTQKRSQTNDSSLKLHLRERLELPKAILSQLRETCLFNDMIDGAINDLDEAMKLLSETEVSIDKS